MNHVVDGWNPTVPSGGKPLEFSVIIPTHSGRISVREAVASVLAQSYEHFELIVVADGEGSITKGLLSDVTDSRLVLVEQLRRGVSAARNLGATTAKNEWVTFLDDDDRARPDWLATWRAHIGPDTVVVTGKLAFWRNSQMERTVQCRLSLTDGTLAAGQLLCGGFALRRETFMQIGGYDEALRFSENHDLGLRLCDFIASTTSGLAMASTDQVVADVLLGSVQSRSERHGTAPGEAAQLFLQRHHSRVVADPAAEASLWRIVSRSKRISGDYRGARSAALRACRLDAGNVRNWITVVMATFPKTTGVARNARSWATSWCQK